MAVYSEKDQERDKAILTSSNNFEGIYTAAEIKAAMHNLIYLVDPEYVPKDVEEKLRNPKA